MEGKCYFGALSLNIYNSNEGRRSALGMPAHLLLPRFYFSQDNGNAVQHVSNELLGLLEVLRPCLLRKLRGRSCWRLLTAPAFPLW